MLSWRRNQDAVLSTFQIERAVIGNDESFDVLEAIRTLLLHKRLIIRCVLAGGVIGLVVVLLLRPTYTATATFLPPNSTSSNSSGLLSQLGALTGGLGGADRLSAP